MKLQESGVTGGYQRTRIVGSNMLSGCPGSCAAGDLVIPSTSMSQNGAESRDLQARRGWNTKSTWHSIAQTHWLRAEVVLLCYLSLACTQAASSSELRCVQPALVSLLDCGNVSKERSVMSPCLSMSQGCSCLVVSVYESCAVTSVSPLGSFRTSTMNPAEMAPSPTSIVDNTSSPPNR